MPSKKTYSTKNNDMTMKVTVLVALVVAFLVGFFIARAKYKPQVAALTNMIQQKDQAMSQMRANANNIKMQDGKMWVVQQGVVKEMSSEVTLSNGDKVEPNGEVIKGDGSKMTLQNGQAMDMDGNMMTSTESN